MRAEMSKKKIILAMLASVCCAEFLVQGSYSFQVNDTLSKLSGYDVKYTQEEASPLDISVGYMISFRDIVVMPVMLEGKTTTVESYVNPEKISANDLAPLEVMLKPGLRLTDNDVYMMLGYQVGSFTQHVETEGHAFELNVKPCFYGAGYTKGMSDYLDYIAEVKVYYDSMYSYALDTATMTLDPDLKISDARVRLGFRVKI